MQMLTIIQNMLKREQSRDKSSINVLPETLSLLGALIPDSRSYKNDKSEFAKNEKEKSVIFDGEENSYRTALVQSILPLMLKLYVSSFNQGVKFSLLQLTEEIILMLSGETLRKYMQPYLFSRFVISTMKSENYTWIETCLRILQILVDKQVTSCNLALYREGIMEYISVYADKDKFKELTGIQIVDEEDKLEEQKEDISMQNLFGDSSSQPLLKSEGIDTSLIETIKESPEEQLNLEEQKEEVKPLQKKEIVASNEELKEEGFVTPEKAEATTPEIPSQTDPAVIKDSEEKTETSEDKAVVPPFESIEEQKEPVEVWDKALSEKVNELKEQKNYLDDLKMAIKESMNEIIESGEDIEAKVKTEMDQEEQKLQSEANVPDDDSEEKKAKSMNQRKIKKMFIKKAIQNMDENLEGLSEIGGFETDEIDRIKDIIAKKRLLHKTKNVYNSEARKYSRDFIGINTAPMYKNIVKTSKVLLSAFEESLKSDGKTEEVTSLQRLTELAESFTDESKNARSFNRERTEKMYRELAEFFKGDTTTTKITQYELFKSNLVHALHNFLSLPVKEEEVKTSDSDKKNPSCQSSSEYMTILSRYV